MSEIAGFIRDINDMTIIIVIAIISVLLECLKLKTDISMENLLIFINIVGIYYILKRVRVNINITYR
jgi:hypothetical protein